MNLDITTERLHLTPLQEEDVDLWLALRMDPDVMVYMAPLQSEEVLREVLPQRCRRGAGGAIGFWRIAERTSGKGIGTGLLLPLPEEEDATDWDALEREGYPEEDVELGYNLVPSEWGKGYATEAARGLLEFAFTQTELERVVAVTHHENHASQNVLRKSGLIDTGLRRAYAQDLPGFEITRKRWQELIRLQ